MDPTPITEKVRFLRRPDAYPEASKQIEVIETHMSWVFLGEQNVYKLKKPVRLDSLDFRTIEARRHNCEQEVRLNRRLAKQIYLGTIPLAINAMGELTLGGSGTIVDWLVRMRRLPQERMLDSAIANHSVDRQDIPRLMQLMTHFYQHVACSVAFNPQSYLAQFEQGIESNYTDLCKPQYEMAQPLIQSLTRAQRRFLETRSDLLKRRASEGCIVEAHGDLRPEHICLLPTPVVIDCLEFNQALRTLDPVDELAYLALECERLEVEALGKQIMDLYQEATDDQVSAALIAFYKTYRACIRAKIALWHLDDRDLQDHEKWRDKAREYLTAAQVHAKLSLL